jgi:predicted nuclease of restriction endonuclease-like (RecB) superfamily
MSARRAATVASARDGYPALRDDVISLLEDGRRRSARAVNEAMASTYWAIGRRIVEQEQRGHARAQYGEEALKRLAEDLTKRFGRGFGWRNLFQMRAFYLAYPSTVAALPPPLGRASKKLQTASAKSPRTKLQTLSAISGAKTDGTFPLPWSHYVKLLGLRSPDARSFYETEALRGGWTVRQLQWQVETQFYERTALSKNKASMLQKGGERRPEDAVTPEEEIKDPMVLEFLGLKDEYSESDLEDALTLRLEHFLLELGQDFSFVGRQRRLRIGDEWYRVDLLFFHRALRCLVVIDLKLGSLTHADAGQMHLYLNYAREHWTRPDENPPVGLILCAKKDAAVAKYALEGLPNKVLAAEYRTTLPDERLLANELDKSRLELARRATSPGRTRKRP